jgi:hypothetical protein
MSDRPVAENSTQQHTTFTKNNAIGEVRIRNPSKREAADALRSHWNKLIQYLRRENLMKEKPTSRWKNIIKIDVT